MDSGLGKIVLFIGLLIIAAGPSVTSYLRTKDPDVWFKPRTLLSNYGKYELMAHLLGMLLVIAGIYMTQAAP